jgi:predicted MPP superfamily phosphohydrolase
MTPDTVNILLSHHPNNFERAAQLGIDLTLAGHTHGGQLSFEFLHRGLCLSLFETPCLSGWYERTAHNSTSTAVSERPTSRSA